MRKTMQSRLIGEKRANEYREKVRLQMLQEQMRILYALFMWELLTEQEYNAKMAPLVAAV